MPANSVVLSLCIPTFNRAQPLRTTLESIVAQPAFIETDDIEVIVSDNCSTDDTVDVVQHFMAQFPGKIFLHRNEVNVGPSENFHIALSAGRGAYLKLLNDYLRIRPRGLSEMVEIVRAASQLKPVIFMACGLRADRGPLEPVATLDDFVQSASYYSTWIAGFGVWRDELLSKRDFLADAASMLPQTHMLFESVASGRGALVIHEKLFEAIEHGTKRGYNLAEVFGKNYVALLKKYRVSGQISQATFDREKREVFLKHTLHYYLDATSGLGKDRFFENLEDYWGEPYFLDAIRKNFPAIWGFNNAHNSVRLIQMHRPETAIKVKVGRRSQGDLCIEDTGAQGEGLTIGDFVSIGAGVRFLLGGDHPHGGISTYSFKSRFRGETEARTRGAIEVGSDVWIGYGALILSGVEIGQGAVVAPGSVVTQDVPAYATVEGNPARVTGYRFDEDAIARLCASGLFALDEAAILDIMDELYADATSENVARLLDRVAERQGSVLPV